MPGNTVESCPFLPQPVDGAREQAARLPEVQYLYAARGKSFRKTGLWLKPGSLVCSKHILDKDVIITTYGRQVRPGALLITNKIVPAKNSLLRTNTKSLRLESGSLVGSKRFLDKDLIDTTSGRQVHSGALPIVNEKVPVKESSSLSSVGVCRICFSTDCELYSMTTSDTLNEAYEKLTGLSTADEEHLPRYLCGQCAGRVVECARFRSRSLRAHVMLLDIVRRHGAVTLELVQSVIRTTYPVNSSPLHNPSNCFDLHNGQLDEVYTLTGARGDMRLDEIKTENGYGIEQNAFNCDDITKDDVVEVKSEIDDLITQDNDYVCPSKVDKDIHVDVVTNASQDGQTVCSSMGQENLAFDVEVKVDIKEDNNSDDEFINRETNDPLASSADLYEHTVGNGLKITLRDEPDYRSSEEASNNIQALTFVGSQAGEQISLTTPETEKKDPDLNELATEDHQSPHDEKSYICDVCKKVFSRKDCLTIHMTIHTGERPHSSDKCGENFLYKNSLNTHIWTHLKKEYFPSTVSENQPREVSYSCNKVLSSEGNINSHLKTKCKKIFSCDFCKKVLSSKQSLNRHTETHSLRIYSCHICNKLMTSKFNLNVHLKTHNAKKPFCCNICNKLLGTLKALNIHLNAHSGDRPYTCDVCKQMFKHKASIYVHIMTMHLKKWK